MALVQIPITPTFMLGVMAKNKKRLQPKYIGSTGLQENLSKCLHHLYVSAKANYPLHF